MQTAEQVLDQNPSSTQENNPPTTIKKSAPRRFFDWIIRGLGTVLSLPLRALAWPFRKINDIYRSSFKTNEATATAKKIPQTDPKPGLFRRMISAVGSFLYAIVNVRGWFTPKAVVNQNEELRAKTPEPHPQVEQTAETPASEKPKVEQTAETPASEQPSGTSDVTKEEEKSDEVETVTPKQEQEVRTTQPSQADIEARMSAEVGYRPAASSNEETSKLSPLQKAVLGADASFTPGHDATTTKPSKKGLSRLLPSFKSRRGSEESANETQSSPKSPSNRG